MMSEPQNCGLSTLSEPWFIRTMIANHSWILVHRQHSTTAPWLLNALLLEQKMMLSLLAKPHNCFYFTVAFWVCFVFYITCAWGMLDIGILLLLFLFCTGVLHFSFIFSPRLLEFKSQGYKSFKINWPSIFDWGGGAGEGVLNLSPHSTFSDPKCLSKAEICSTGESIQILDSTSLWNLLSQSVVITTWHGFKRRWIHGNCPSLDTRHSGHMLPSSLVCFWMPVAGGGEWLLAYLLVCMLYTVRLYRLLG